MKLLKLFVACALGVTAVSAIFAARAQTSQPNDAALPSFEVASIKVNNAPPRMGGIRFPGPSGEFTATISAKMLIMLAYEVKDFQISGTPTWAVSQAYDIDAKEDSATAARLQQLPPEQRIAQARLMLQSLLADRFHLVFHHATTQAPMFSLVVSKPGRIPVSQSDCGPPGSPQPPPPSAKFPEVPCGGFFQDWGHIAGTNAPIDRLVYALSVFTGETVLDHTDLTGKYNIALDWTPDPGQAPPRPGNAAPQPDPNGPSLQDALEDQLGLKLVSTKGPADTIVIDHIEEPSPN